MFYPRRFRTERHSASKQTRLARIERLEPRMVLSAGIVTTSISTSTRAFACFLDSSQDIVLAGDAGTTSNRDFAVLRYQSDGALDPAFGQGGWAITPIGVRNDTATAAVAWTADGILAAGGAERRISATAYQNDFALARYTPNGSLDTQFSGDGKLQTDLGQSESVGDVLLQPDGKIVIAGSSGGQFVLVRYTAAGALDPTFGAGGIVRTGVAAAGSIAATMHQGKILMGGTTQGLNDPNDLILVRCNADGSLDSSFGTGGVVVSNFDSDVLRAIGVDGQDRILVAISLYRGQTTGHQDFALARYLPGGALDTTFDGDGLAETDFTPPGEAEKWDQPAALAVQPDGTIVVVGSTCYNAPRKFAVARYNDDGSLDASFGQDFDADGMPDGKVITPILRFAEARSVALQSDGKIVVAGSTHDTDSSKKVVAMARYLPNGSLDPDFGPLPALSIGDVSKSEGNGGWTTPTQFSFVITLSSVSGVPVTVQYATANGTAIAGSDFQATSGTLTIPAGALSATVTVSVNGDTTKEANETFYVNLSSPSGATIADGQALGTIVNDESKTTKSSSAALSATDLYFLSLSLSTKRDSDPADLFDVQTADELLIMQLV